MVPRRMQGRNTGGSYGRGAAIRCGFSHGSVGGAKLPLTPPCHDRMQTLAVLLDLPSNRRALFGVVLANRKFAGLFAL